MTTICYQAYDDLRRYLGFPPNGYSDADMGAGAWAGVVTPHAEIYDRLHSDVQMAGMGSPDTWSLDIQYGDKYDTYVDEWGTTVVRPKGGHYFDYRIFPIQHGTVEAVHALESLAQSFRSGTLAGLSATLSGRPRHRAGVNSFFSLWRRHFRTTGASDAHGGIFYRHCFRCQLF